jgi:hypothetical protein
VECTQFYTFNFDTSSIGRGEDALDEFLEVTERQYEIILYDPRGVSFKVEIFLHIRLVGRNS